MKFQDCIAKEHDDEFSGKTRWRLEITSPPERLILHSWKAENGIVKYPSFYSVLAKDLDPQSITIQEPNEEGELYSLSVNCAFYRDAFVEKREDEPSFVYRCVKFNFPISNEISDVDSAKRSFDELLKNCGARSPVINAAAVEDLLEPLRAALEPCGRAVMHSQDKKTTFKQSVTVDGQKMHLICQTERASGRKRIPLWELPMSLWSIRKDLTPQFEWDTFELLSLDTKEIEVQKDPDEMNTWKVSLYSVDRLDTRVHSDSAGPGTYRMWYVRVYFPAEAEANHFASVCSSSVEQIRERLYQLHQKAV
jgi:hypothetical protein